MFPYDYTKENYARTGFVYEGITTYYGDKLLFTSDVFSEKQYFATLEERLNKHFNNYGRFNLSVADSSFDNWLDGYAPGAPYRKVSIYDEGNLIAFMLDVLILKHTNNEKSLREVMRNLYNEFYLKNKGYSEDDINSIVHFVAGVSFDEFFSKYVYGTEDYEKQLEECFQYLGLNLVKHPADKFFERYLGFKATEHGHHKKVTMVAPYSPAWKAELSIHDEIIGINGFQLKSDLNNWLQHFDQAGKKIELTVLANGRIRSLEINYHKDKEFFPVYTIQHSKDTGSGNFNVWKSKS
jgi:predicted metalloprotease with PDZ domain